MSGGRVAQDIISSFVGIFLLFIHVCTRCKYMKFPGRQTDRQHTDRQHTDRQHTVCLQKCSCFMTAN